MMTLDEKRSTLIAYLRLKVEEEDWHGVADAACDLREVEVARRFPPLTNEVQPASTRRQK